MDPCGRTQASIDLGSIRRTVRTTLALTGVAFLALLAYGRTEWAYGVGLGSAWACANWVLITALVRLLLTPDRSLRGRSKIRLAVLVLVKFPLLYGCGYLLLRLGLPVVSLLLGFWIILAVAVAKALGRLILGMDAIPVPGGAGRSEGKTT